MVLFHVTSNGLTIAAISFGIALTSSLVRRAVLDQEKMDEMKEKMNKHKEDLKEATDAGNDKKAKEAQDKLMKMTIENMKHSFKPMLYTIIPFILIFTWLRGQFGDVGTVATVLDFELTWFWWYLICTMAISMILKKGLDIT